MQDTAVSPERNTGLPPFYTRLVGLDPKLHGNLRIDRAIGFRFAAEAQFVPLGLTEIEAAACDYPILFTMGAEPIPIALLGLYEGRNLFLRADGSWRPGCYIPACIRAFPFLFLKSPTSDDLFLGMDPNAECLQSDSGEPLFEDGKPSDALNEAIRFGVSYRRDLMAASELASALDATGVLGQQDATVTFASGATAVVRGFKKLSAERLSKVNDETFLEWRHSNWIPAVNAHVLSTGNWRRLVEMSTEPRLSVTH
jgi:hypothetical protein